jgi:hypothetical protein
MTTERAVTYSRLHQCPPKSASPAIKDSPKASYPSSTSPVVSGIVKDGTSHKLSVKAHVDEPFADGDAGALNTARPRAVLWQGQRLC